MRDATCTLIYNNIIKRDFNPRIPCGMRPPIRKSLTISDQYFNPRIPCGMRHDGDFYVSGKYVFQSTHPMRDATCSPWNLAQVYFISIHASHAGCDLFSCKADVLTRISIHASHAGCDTVKSEKKSHKINFNPRIPCGMRRLNMLLLTAFQ